MPTKVRFILESWQGGGGSYRPHQRSEVRPMARGFSPQEVGLIEVADRNEKSRNLSGFHDKPEGSGVFTKGFVADNISV